MTTGLKTLTAIAVPINLASKASLLRPFHLPHQLHHRFHFPILRSASPFFPLCSLPEKSSAKALPNGAGEAVSEASKNGLLQVVLVSPQIPGNVGSIARTCAASGVKLHLVEPLGFQIDDTKLKRAGLDYWPTISADRLGTRGFWHLLREGQQYIQRGDWLVFGSETKGLSPEILLDCKTQPHGGGTLRIPMVETYVRCLNLSVSVGIALYEASRQINYEQLQSDPEPCTHISFTTEDIFA